MRCALVSGMLLFLGQYSELRPCAYMCCYPLASNNSINQLSLSVSQNDQGVHFITMVCGLLLLFVCLVGVVVCVCFYFQCLVLKGIQEHLNE